VSDGAGPAAGLRPDDFDILDEGHQQHITSFGYESLPPGEPLRAIVVVIDDLGIDETSMAAVYPALDNIARNMHPGDAIAVVTTSGNLRTLQKLSADKRTVTAAVEKIALAPDHRASVLEPAFCRREDAAPSVLRTLSELRRTVDGLRDLPARKSIVLVSEGFSPGLNRDTREAYSALLSYANRSAVTVNTVDPRGSVLPSECGQERQDELQASRRALFELAAATGGVFASAGRSLDAAISQAVLDGTGYYRIGYEPSRQTSTHLISVRVKRPGLTVRYHDSLFESTGEDLGRRMTAALDSPFELPGVRARVYSVLWDSDETGQTIRSAVWVDARDLTFTTEADGTRKAVFDLVAETLGAKREVIDTFRQSYTVSAPPAYYQTILSDGLTQRLQVPIKSFGLHQVRIAVHDEASKRIGSATAFVDAPYRSQGALALSGIAIAKSGDQSAAPGTSPRRFHPGQTVTIGYRIRNGQRVEVTILLKHAGHVLAATNPTPVDGTRSLQLREFQFGDDLEPGTYTLEVRAVDQNSPAGHNSAEQSVEFEIE
jgi:VWFA-related protein